MNKLAAVILVLGFAFAMSGRRVLAQTGQVAPIEACTPIDFETVPGETPKEGVLISKQFEKTHGITFTLEDGTLPRLAAVGRPATAFLGPPRDTGADTPAPNQGVGQFFLTDDGTLDGLKPSPLLVRYSPPTANASGVLLDVDYDETFTIEALDGKGAVLSTLSVKAKEPSTGDGMATRWSVSHEAADIAAIRVAGRRTAGGRFGLGFDLFCAAEAPPRSCNCRSMRRCSSTSTKPRSSPTRRVRSSTPPARLPRKAPAAFSWRGTPTTSVQSITTSVCRSSGHTRS